MIRSIHLRNFQAHKDLLLRFDPGVNALVGPSDVGKTAVLRALTWVCFNRPASVDGLVSHGEKEVSVVVTLDDGTEIERARSGSKNIYRVGEKTFTAFGRGIPDEVITALRLGEINFSSQHAAPFLLSASPGDVARTINNIAHLEKIDAALSNVSQMSREVGQDIARAHRTVREAREGMERFSRLKLLRERTAEITERATTLTDLGKQYAELAEALGRLQSAQTRMRRSPSVSPLQTALESAENKLNEWRGLVARGSVLARGVDAIHKAVAYVAQTEARLTEAATKYRQAQPKTCPLCGQSWPE